MSELTKQHFDQQLGKLATKEDIRDVRVALEEKIEMEVANLARMTNNGLEEIKKELDVKKRVDNLDHRIFRIEQALNIASK